MCFNNFQNIFKSSFILALIRRKVIYLMIKKSFIQSYSLAEFELRRTMNLE